MVTKSYTPSKGTWKDKALSFTPKCNTIEQPRLFYHFLLGGLGKKKKKKEETWVPHSVLFYSASKNSKKQVFLSLPNYVTDDVLMYLILYQDTRVTA